MEMTSFTTCNICEKPLVDNRECVCSGEAATKIEGQNRGETLVALQKTVKYIHFDASNFS